MKRFFTYLISTFLLLAVQSCDPLGNASGEGTENGGGGGKPETPQENELTIKADRTEIKADGSESVTFTVMFGSEDVSTKKTMHIIKEFDGKTENMANGANVFSTTAPGTYKFTAYLYSDGQHLSENSVTVTATKVEAAQTYVQKIIGEQFTSLGCQSCPGLSTAIKKVQEDMPGVMIPVSFHMDFSSIADPMSIDATAAFMKYHAFQGLPYFNLNFHKAGGVNASASAIMEAMEEELQNNPATCGVAIDTEYDGTSGKLNVVAKITSNSEVRHKYHIFVVEDGITGYDQMGATPSYVHDNVVRVMVAPQVTGLDINSRNPFTPGVEVTAEKTVTVKDGWNIENMRVVVAALTTLDGGATWTCSNANECKLGESVDYCVE